MMAYLDIAVSLQMFFIALTIELCGRQPPHPKDKMMTETTTTAKQDRVAADCPNEHFVRALHIWLR
jgi:hypothetical protein